MKKLNKKTLFAGITSTAITAATALTLTAVSASAADEPLYGDANGDGKVTIADATAVLQSIVNSKKYGLSPEGEDLADVYERGDGITPADALSIQRYDAGAITSLPESWKDGEPTTEPPTEPNTEPTTEDPTDPVDPVTTETLIHLNGSSIKVEGDYAEVNGSVVTITHSGSFIIDGTLEDGQINVNVPDEKADPETVKIFLNGVNITGKSTSPILITNAENTSINLMDGTENFISDGDTAYLDGNAVIEAKDDLTIKGGELGTGVLNLTANTQNGIVCNNDIKINGGVINIETLNSTDKTNGINGKKSLTVKDGTLSVDAAGDGIKSSKGDVKISGGNTSIKAGNDAVQAETTIDISGGTLLAGGDRGLTAVTGVNITGGTVVATATDNQVDTAILGGSTQPAMLLNCIASAETDGAWKKANALQVGDVKFEKWTKKYSFVLISSSSIIKGHSYNLINASTGTSAEVNNNVVFEQKDNVTVFNDVNPVGTTKPNDQPGGTDTPSVDPASGDYTITLSGSSLSSNAPADAASISNGTLTIKQPGTFAVSGTAKDVQIVVDVDKTAYPDGVVELDLVGADISNSTTAPIYVANIGDEVQIVAKKDTVNTISDGTQHTQRYTDADGNTNTVEGAIFARDDIKFKGTGSLTINGNTDDAIVCKNDIKIFNGNITVNAVDDGIRGKDSVTIGKADDTDYSTLSVTVKTKGGDGIKSTDDEAGSGIVTINGGTVDINAYADGIQAEQEVVINGGDLNIYTYQGSGYTGSGTTTGGNQGGGRPGGGFGGGGMGMDGNPNKVENSAKGIKAVGVYDAAGTTWQSGGNITINGGNITIDSSDDAVHCGGSMAVYGGQFKIMTADDAFHSDHDLTLGTKGGAYGDFGIYVSKCYEGIEGQNIYQYSGTVIVKADDDGYNAAGGSDGSGNQNPGGWFGGGGFGGGGGNYALNISGGIAIVQSASGDHDAFDSNGSLTVSGGIVIANGNEPLDSDGTNTANGGTVLAVSQGSTVAANTQFTVADSTGKVIVSFKTMQAMGSISQKHTDGTVSMYTGGTISGGVDLIELDSTQPVYASGTISGGTTVSAGGSTGGFNPWG